VKVQEGYPSGGLNSSPLLSLIIHLRKFHLVAPFAFFLLLFSSPMIKINFLKCRYYVLTQMTGSSYCSLRYFIIY